MMEVAIKKITEEDHYIYGEQRITDYFSSDTYDAQFIRKPKPEWPLWDELFITKRHETNRAYHFEINSKNYQVPSRLKHIAQHIEEAQDILRYEFDWDDEGACPADITTFENAVSFIINYSVSIYTETGRVLKTPYIDILRDGSVSVHWESDNAQLLIIFKKGTSDLAYYYAELKGSKVPLKSAIEPGKPVDEFLALWMQKYLS